MFHRYGINIQLEFVYVYMTYFNIHYYDFMILRFIIFIFYYIMIINIKVISFIIIILFIIYILYIKRNCMSTKIYTFESNKPGPTILIVAGTHGNEPAASHYFSNFVNASYKFNFKPKSGKIIIIPRVNDCALKLNMRSTPLIGDINRKYYKYNKVNEIVNRETNGINQQIMKIIDTNKIDFVLDFHEGYDFHNMNMNSLGSTITYTKDNTGKAKKFGEYIVEKLNETIDDVKKKFTLLDCNYKPIKGTLLDYLSDLNISGILIETSGQNNIQPLKVRLEQIDLIFNTFL